MKEPGHGMNVKMPYRETPSEDDRKAKPREDGQSGAVMLEYVIILLVFVCLLMAWNSSVYSTATGFGVLGREIADMYQRVMSGISLPVP